MIFLLITGFYLIIGHFCGLHHTRRLANERYEHYVEKKQEFVEAQKRNAKGFYHEEYVGGIKVDRLAFELGELKEDLDRSLNPAYFWRTLLWLPLGIGMTILYTIGTVVVGILDAKDWFAGYLQKRTEIGKYKLGQDIITIEKDLGFELDTPAPDDYSR